MTSRERVIRAIEFNGPDRIPVRHSVSPGAFRQHGAPLVKLLEKYRDDFDNESIKPNIKIAREELDASSREVIEYRDEWGALWRRLKGYSVGEVIEPALPTWDKWGDYQFPPSLSKEYFREFEKTIKCRHPEYYVFEKGGSLFHLMQFIRGTGEVLIDLADDKSEVHELADQIVDFNIRNIKGYLSIGVDGISLADDWGTQIALFISPDMWRRFFKPRYKKMFAVIRDAGKHVFFHSCGWTLEILDDLAEIGVDVINPQHHIMGDAEVARRIGDKMCLRSDFDRQYILPRGTPEEIFEHVREVIALFGNRNGGLILQGEIGPEIPFDNIEAMYGAFHKYGCYPLSLIHPSANDKTCYQLPKKAVTIYD